MRHDSNRACLASRGDRQAAAPVNNEPHWPAGYVDVLRQAGAQEKIIPYHDRMSQLRMRPPLRPQNEPVGSTYA